MYDKIFLALLETSSSHAKLSRKEFQKLDLTEGQPKVLYILKRGEGIVQKELADICGVRQSTLTVLLEKMIGKELIAKETVQVSGGKRAYRIYLTDKGRFVADKVEEAVEKLEAESFKGFSEKEREQLFLMLERISENLKE